MTHRIQNYDELAVTPLRRDALALAEVGYEAINVAAALRRKLVIEHDALRIGEKQYPLANRRIYFVGVGKCAFVAAGAMEQILGPRLTGGIAIDPSPPPAERFERITLYQGTHPLPSNENEAATAELFSFLSGRKESDLVLMLISGGGSTLLCLHDAPMTCVDEGILFNELTHKGASIQEINTVRKHISRARGGGLARACYPAEVLSLIVSDVPGNDLGFISSGPTVLDTSTVKDAEDILKRYEIPQLPSYLLFETEKDPHYFERVTNELFLTNEDALDTISREAERLGYRSTIVDTHLTGEASEVGRQVVSALHEAPGKTALLYGGETTVTITEQGGNGGRNLEMAIAALPTLTDNELVLPLASDGHDNCDRAGGIADSLTRTHAEEKAASIDDNLRRHTSLDFFDATGDALITGYTGSNVSDIIIALKD